MRILVAIFVAALVSCASSPNRIQEAHFGGASYRVFEADRIDSPDLLFEIAVIHKEVQRCLGMERSLDGVAFYRVSAIMRFDDEPMRGPIAMSENWKWPLGMITKAGDVYLLNLTTVYDRRRILKHELAHWVLEQSHPEIDEAMIACGIEVTINPQIPRFRP